MNSSEKPARQFRGWFIPAAVIEFWRRKEIHSTELLLLAMIDSFVRIGERKGDNEGCFAGTEHLAQEMGVNDRTITRMIEHLRDLGLLYRKKSPDRRRHLFTCFSLGELSKSGTPPGPSGPSVRQGLNVRHDGPSGPNIYPPLKGSKDITHRCGATGERGEGFGLVDPKPKPPFHVRAAKHLLKTLTIHRKVMRRPHLIQWARHFHELEGMVGRDRVRRILKWYRLHCGWKFAPQTYSGKTFVEKFVQLEEARKRWKQDNFKTNTNRLTEEDQEILTELKKRDLHWPKGSAAQVQAVVQVSLRQFKQWRAASLRVATKDDYWKLFVKRTRNSIHQEPVGFVISWMVKVNREVTEWTEWHGDLARYTFTPSHKLFQRWGADEDRYWSDSTARWDNKQAAIQKSIAS